MDTGHPGGQGTLSQGLCRCFKGLDIEAARWQAGIRHQMIHPPNINDRSISKQWHNGNSTGRFVSHTRPSVSDACRPHLPFIDVSANDSCLCKSMVVRHAFSNSLSFPVPRFCESIMRDIKWTDHPAVTSQPTLCFGNSTSMNHELLIINVGGTGVDISRPGITVVISPEVMV